MNLSIRTVCLIFALLGAFGCTAAPPSAEIEPQAQFQVYRQALAKMKERDLLERYWAKASAAEGLPALGDNSLVNKANRNAIVYSIRFPEQMTSTTRITQAINGDLACVRVEGKSREGEGVIFRIPYVLEQGSWRIKEVFIVFPPPGSVMTGEPICSNI